VRFLLALFAALLAAAPAAAQGVYPARAIRLLVPGSVGSPPDTLARIFAEPLAAALGQPVLVEDRPGGFGTLALGAVSKAAPDGHTLGITGLAQTVAPNLLAAMPYDVLRDFAPVTQLAWTANVLVVSPASPLHTIGDFVALAKAQPGRLTYASAGNGSPSHLASELLRHRAGIEVRHIPFKGIPAGLTAVMAGQVDFAFGGVAAALPHVQGGRLRALATAGARRLPVLPGVPTVAELGYVGFQLNEWYGVTAPAGTPPAVIARLETELARIAALPQVRAQLGNLGLYPAEKLGAPAMRALIAAELPRWKKVVDDAGIRAE
jgi:tripartite-type tricarboxylate transporter receptor subunit TctC